MAAPAAADAATNKKEWNAPDLIGGILIFGDASGPETKSC